MNEPEPMFLFKNPKGTWERLVSSRLGKAALAPDFSGLVYFGTEPEPEAISGVRTALYESIEQSLSEWISERKFIPRFLISALVFSLVYFFLSFVIRDPIPFVDEFVGGLVSAIITWFMLSRRDLNSLLAAEMRQELKARIDAIHFMPSPDMEDLEAVLLHLDTETDISLDASLEALSNVIDAMSEEKKLAFLTIAQEALSLRLPSERVLKKWTLEGLSLETWKAWCIKHKIPVWPACLALAGRSLQSRARIR